MVPEGHLPPAAYFRDFELVMHRVLGARTESTNFFSVFAHPFDVLVASTIPVRLMQTADGVAPSAGDDPFPRAPSSAMRATPAQPRMRGTSLAHRGLRRMVAIWQP